MHPDERIRNKVNIFGCLAAKVSEFLNCDFTVTYFYPDGIVALERDYFDSRIVVFVHPDGFHMPSRKV